MTDERIDAMACLLRDEANLAFHGLGLSETCDWEQSKTRDGWRAVARTALREALTPEQRELYEACVAWFYDESKESEDLSASSPTWVRLHDAFYAAMRAKCLDLAPRAASPKPGGEGGPDHV